MRRRSQARRRASYASLRYSSIRTDMSSMTPAGEKALPEPCYPAKIAQAHEAVARIGALAKPRVFTNGVFDVLHRGHVTYLEQARGLGASLVVAVNSDDSVRSLGKGGDRPLNPLDDRMAVLAALACAGLVVPFGEETRRERIGAWLPDR